jgi:hypothetical protein
MNPLVRLAPTSGEHWSGRATGLYESIHRILLKHNLARLDLALSEAVDDYVLVSPTWKRAPVFAELDFACAIFTS